MKTPKLLLFLLLLTISSFVSAQKIEEKNIKTHIKFLSDDALQGRFTGSAGERLALGYIEKQFKALKLQPKGESDSFEQKFPFKSGVHGTGTEGTAHNAVAFLDNKADKTIIIGAHFDHLGLGENGTMVPMIMHRVWLVF
jgi:hypothetical protein